MCCYELLSLKLAPPFEHNSAILRVVLTSVKSIAGAALYAVAEARVGKITMAPDTLEVEITYKIPEAIGE